MAKYYEIPELGTVAEGCCNCGKKATLEEAQRDNYAFCPNGMMFCPDCWDNELVGSTSPKAVSRMLSLGLKMAETCGSYLSELDNQEEDKK